MSKIIPFEFPVYIIGQYDTLYNEDNIIRVITLDGKTRIIDNKNIPGNTLAVRRLQLNSKDAFTFKGTIFTFSQLLKLHHPNNWYIDVNGFLFKYRKTTIVPLIWRKILSVDYIEGRGLNLRVKDIDVPIRVPAGTPITGYIGLLKLMDGYILYGISNTPKKDTWRKI